ncbi:MAG TPA: Hint domain-containing protein [Candidatus Paceibacterota bacterium]|nr:Hint domain-containing protein [Candidatus Paceibacterota bacterium]
MVTLIKKETIRSWSVFISVIGVIAALFFRFSGLKDADITSLNERVQNTYSNLIPTVYAGHSGGPSGGGASSGGGSGSTGGGSSGGGSSGGGSSGGGSSGGGSSGGGSSGGGSSGGGSTGGGGCGGSCGGSCFLAGTLIAMADESDKPIEQIVKGDKVLGWNTDTQTREIAEVIETFTGKIGPVYKINNGICVTGDHPFWVVNKGWAAVAPEISHATYNFDLSKLEIGDLLMKADQTTYEVTAIDMMTEDAQTVYNLSEVSTPHTFFASGVLVHNKRI